MKSRRSAAALVPMILAALVALALINSGSSPAAAATPDPPQGLFVQVSSLGAASSPATVASWISHVCAGRDLVLQDISGTDGVLITSYIDVIAPYLPGGAHACFRRVFVGTVDLPWTGAGSKYVDGVESESFRRQNIALSDSVARAFVTRYPWVHADWYLTYEANLNEVYYPAVERSYADLLGSEMRLLSRLRPQASFAWSPAFWFPYSTYRLNLAGMSQLRTMLSRLFSTLRAEGRGIQLLDLQDFVAGSGCQPVANRVTPSDAVAWAHFLVGLRQLPDVAINVEQYAVDCRTGQIGLGNRQGVVDREAFYSSNGVRLGPAFEIRYWMPLHGQQS